MTAQKERISIFEYSRRKAEAEMKKYKLQQQVVDMLLALDFRRHFAEEVAEQYHAGENIKELSPGEAAALNKLLAKIHKLSRFTYELDQTTTLY